jgi:hypothetical protein
MSEWSNDKLTPELKRAYLFQEHLAYLDTKRTEAYMSDNVMDWIKICDRIFIYISFALNESDFKSLDKKIKVIKNKLLSENKDVIDDIRELEVLLFKFQHEGDLLYPKTVNTINDQKIKKDKFFDRKGTSEDVFEGTPGDF